MIGAIICVGVSHRAAPLELRERLAIPREALPDFLRRAREVWPECVILKTCGRFEIYGLAREGDALDASNAFAMLVGVDINELQPYIRQWRGEEAATHLFRVVAGLESPILGEEQILGQVRDAFLFATEQNAVGPFLSAMFRGAIHAGKRVRRETSLNAASRSYARLAVQALLQSRSHTNPYRIIVVGGGTLAAEAIETLRSEGLRGVTVVSRHIDRASALAARVDGIGCSLDELNALVAETDAVLACASLSRPIINIEMLEGRKRPLAIVDLGMPRNVDSRAAGLPNVTLKTLDEIVGQANVVGADVFIGAAERIIEEERRLFVRWLKARQVAPSVTKLQAWAAGLDRETARRIKHIIHNSIQRWQEGVVL